MGVITLKQPVDLPLFAVRDADVGCTAQKSGSIMWTAEINTFHTLCHVKKIFASILELKQSPC